MGIKLSPQHGVNPMLVACFFCGETTNEIALLGRLPGDREAPRRGVLDHTPCDTCRGHMKAGVILVCVRDGETGDNPYRTGGFVVLKDEAFARVWPDLAPAVLKSRFAFMERATWDAVGLPHG